MNQQIIVIGAGQWGQNLVRTYYELGALAAVVEADANIRSKLIDYYGNIPFYDDYKEAMTHHPSSAVVVATPAHTHYSLAEYALLAYRDVFIEKPLTLSSVEAERLLDLADRKKCILMVGHLLLYQPAIQKMKSLIDTGAIGTLKSLHQERMKLGRVRSVENVLWSFGVHDIAVLLYLIGQPPIHVQASGQAIVQSNIEDDVYMHLVFDNDVQAHLHTSWLWPEMRRRLTAIGDQGQLVYDEEKQEVILHLKGIHPDLSNRDDGSGLVYSGSEQPLKLECEHFLDCIATRKTPISDGRNGLETVRILEKASSQLKRERI